MNLGIIIGIYSGILLFGIAPLISVLLVAGLCRVAHCVVSEAGPEQCRIFGMDFGNLFYVMFTAGWAIFITVPISLALGAIFTLGILVFSIR